MVGSNVDLQHMGRALALAQRGQGLVEPNPMVGCVIARGTEVLAEGFHQRCGGPHAEIEALNATAGLNLADACLYVTLEPCCHHGKTPPCVDAILQSGIRRIVVAMQDPFHRVNGAGAAALRARGITVEMGCCAGEAARLTAPYVHLLKTGRPWVLAKWAMSLDGRIATETGDSQWISNKKSREIVHQLRGRMDAIVVGRGTVERDNPRLTARPPGARVAVRVVLDRTAQLSLESQLVASRDEAPIMVVTAANRAPSKRTDRLKDLGCEILPLDGMNEIQQVQQLCDEFGRRGMTNVLVEGGSKTLGSFFAASVIREFHVFVAPKVISGTGALAPLHGPGVPWIKDAQCLTDITMESTGEDTYIRARCSPTHDLPPSTFGG